MAFILAHLSDPHLGPLPPASLRELAGKRLIGWLNWRANRGGRHSDDTLDALLADIRAHRPDRVALTGDLVNLALDAEFPPATAWLNRLGAELAVSLVPGNHDAYVRTAAAHRHWAAFMADEAAPADLFPYVHRHDDVALIGVSTAVATPPFMATGRIGARQMAALGDALSTLRGEGRCRVVLIHHPPVGRIAAHKRLTDAGALRALLARVGAELVLHGHTHHASRTTLPGQQRPIPVLGVTSASASPIAQRPASWNRIAIAPDVGGWRIAVERRGWRQGGQAIESLERVSFPA